MKTTVEIPASLLDQARKLAASEGTTIRALVEEGLRKVIRERQNKPFRLRDASFQGNGLQPQVAHSDWEQIRDMAYEGRGS